MPNLLRIGGILFALRLLLAGAAATAAGQTAAMTEPDNGPNLPAQPIGPNDLLAIAVYGAPELTRSVRVSAEGLIRLPMLKEKVPASGLMPAELETRIAQALQSADLLVDPIVSVTIAEYHSHPVNVTGAVKSPLTFQAVGRTTLLEAITRAQGLSEDAGPEILVTTSTGGEAARTQTIAVKALIDAADPASNILLEGGEEIRIPPLGRVFVVGNVKHPGAFRMEDGSAMTVLKALAMAEGLAPFAAREAYIYRHSGSAPASGAQELPVELRKIMDRKTEDVGLRSNDILYVPDNRSGRTAMNVIEKAVGFATATASGALILGLH